MDIIKTLIKYTAIGMISAIVVLYFTQNGSIPGKPGTVDIKEISVDDANKLAEANRQAANTTTSYSHAVKATSPAVVNIYTAKVVAQRPRLYDDPLFKHFFGDSGRSIPRKRLETSLGSGVIISEQGHIITNN
ncbi:MAG TPA: transcriptional regulator, partial [Gammaproteobacteria bacterium]|nr:transcriptional regulator [Gammaproteobacteria bacterium]